MAPARTLYLAALIVLGPIGTIRAQFPLLRPSLPNSSRTIIVGSGLNSEQTLIFSTALAAADHPGVLLLDTPGARTANRRFIDEFKPADVVTLDSPSAGDVSFDDGFWFSLFPTAERIIVVNTPSRRLQILAAALAGAARAPLFIWTGPADSERAENLLLLARPGAIAAERRDNPVAGKDPFIEMEPLTPANGEPFTFATGRLFHADPGMVALILARSRLLPPDGSPRTALVA